MTDEETKKDAMSEDEMAKKAEDILNDTKVTAGTKIIIECTSNKGGSDRMSLHHNIHGTAVQLIKMLNAAMQMDKDLKEVIKAAVALDAIAVSHTIVHAKTEMNEERN